jgi:ribosomal protein S12
LLDATVDFDVFSKKNQKVTVIAKLVRNQVSNGFNITGFISTKGRVSELAQNDLLGIKFFQQQRIR